VVFGCAIVAFLAAFSAAGASAASRDDTVVIALPSFPQGIDLNVQGGPGLWEVASQVMALGMDWKRIPYPYGPHNGVNNKAVPGFTYPSFDTLEPGILKSCVISNGGRTATYNLRPNVKSAYGNEFTSADVIWMVKRALVYHASGEFMLNAVNAGKLSQWKAVNRYTVRITSQTPMPLICKINTNEYWFYPDSKAAMKRATKKDPWGNKWMATNGASFGPYYVTQWVPGQKIVLTANPNYYGKRPTIKTVIFQVVPSEANRVSLLRSGAIQVAYGLSPISIESLKSTPNVRPLAIRNQAFAYVALNNKVSPLNNVRVRQALQYAVPRDEILKNVYRGFGNAWQGVTPSIFPDYIAHSKYSGDVDKAKALLTAAGYPNGFTETLNYNTNDPIQPGLAVVLQSAFRNIGVNLTLAPVPGNAYSDLILSRKFKMALTFDQSIQPDFNYTLQLYYHSKSFPNYSSYANPRVDAILEKCVSMSGKAAFNCNKQAVPIIYDESPHLWIAETDLLMAISSRLGGFGWWTNEYFMASHLYYR
jgi:peptide/nickel transport system substrate-binding protein